MFHEILFALWFFLPAGFANIAPILAAHWSVLKPYDQPIDAGKKWRGKPILGKNKTWRGFAAGWVMAVAVLGLQVFLVNNIDALANWSLIEYSELPFLLVATLQAFGALTGDAVKSFFKRQKDIQSGKSWMPFDQLDYVLGAVLFTYAVVELSVVSYAGLIVFGFLAHIASTHVGYWLKLKDQPI